jgi:hypothetical protein
MKVRLIKMNVNGHKHYYLKDQESRTIATTNFPFPEPSIILANSYGITLQKLSYDNCEAIELGCDLNELAEKWIDDNGKKWSNNNNEVGDNYGSFKAGFMKAIELNAKKEFTVIDLINCWNKALMINEHNSVFTDFLRSIQTNVEIVMSPCVYDDSLGGFSTSYQEGMPTEKPKLDHNGCLILKRV